MGQGQSTVLFINDSLQRKLAEEEIPHTTRLAWIELDKRIQAINAEARLVHYERRRLRDYVAHMQALHTLEKSLKSAR